MIDAHVHVACADTDRYRRDPTPDMGSEWWRTHGDAEELLALVQASGIRRVVVVHAGGLYGFDCRCAADVVAAHRDRCALVGQVDPATDDIASALRSLGTMGATGVRVMATRDVGWLGDERAPAIWRAAADANLVLLVTIRPDGIETMADLCRAYPATTAVLDHGGFVHVVGPGAETEMLRLADIPSAYVKITTHNLDIPEPGSWVRRVADRFGAERLCWGSDFPQIEGREYGELLRIGLAAAAELDDTERASFLDGTSARLWWPNITQ